MFARARCAYWAEQHYVGLYSTSIRWNAVTTDTFPGGEDVEEKVTFACGGQFHRYCYVRFANDSRGTDIHSFSDSLGM